LDPTIKSSDVCIGSFDLGQRLGRDSLIPSNVPITRVPDNQLAKFLFEKLAPFSLLGISTLYNGVTSHYSNIDEQTCSQIVSDFMAYINIY
jgi:hypothetical protein